MLPKLHIHWERWKYNDTFEIYVSNLGHFRNKSKADLAPKIGHNGYMWIWVQGSQPGWELAHRVVMLTWRPTPEADKLTVDHLDHNKRDNSVDNLEWVTREENLRRADEDYLPTILGPVKVKSKKRQVIGVYCEGACSHNKHLNYTVRDMAEASAAFRYMIDEYLLDQQKGFNKAVRDLLKGTNTTGAKNGVASNLPLYMRKRNDYN